jgi:hypothetical protein
VFGYCRQTIQVPPRRCNGRGRGTEAKDFDALVTIPVREIVAPSPEPPASVLPTKEEPTVSTPAETISDELILAALDRAIRHGGRGCDAIAGSIYDHLDIPSRSGPARYVYRRLPVLEGAGALERARRLGFVVWSPSSKGRRRLDRALRAGSVELPESPQHREWRNARTLAEREINRFREEIRDCITDAMELVDAESHSDVLFEIAHRLHFEYRRLASATYCLSEWAEPDDAHPDDDERLTPAEMKLDVVERARLRWLRAGRRNIQYWSEQSTTAGRD